MQALLLLFSVVKFGCLPASHESVEATAVARAYETVGQQAAGGNLKTKAVPLASLDDEDWSDVPLEESVAEGFNWQPALQASPQGEALSSARSPEFPSGFEDLRADIPLEGHVPAFEKKKRSVELERAKRLAANFVLHRPSKKTLTLSKKDILTGADLQVFEETEKRRKKRREKLELERLKRQQQKKYHDKVELVEKQASRKRKRFKALRKTLAFLAKVAEGGK